MKIHQGDIDVRGLMSAVLADAIVACSGGGGIHRAYGLTKRQAQDEARAWIRNDDVSHTFAFEVVCDVLGIDPDAIRYAVATGNYDRRICARRMQGYGGSRIGERRGARGGRRAKG